MHSVSIISTKIMAIKLDCERGLFHNTRPQGQRKMEALSLIISI